MQPLIKTPFGFGSTAADVIHGTDLTGKQAIVTGGSSGIGIDTAHALASAGAHVTLAVRRLDAGEKVAADIRASTMNPHVKAAYLDPQLLKAALNHSAVVPLGNLIEYP